MALHFRFRFALFIRCKCIAKMHNAYMCKLLCFFSLKIFDLQKFSKDSMEAELWLQRMFRSIIIEFIIFSIDQPKKERESEEFCRNLTLPDQFFLKCSFTIEPLIMLFQEA